MPAANPSQEKNPSQAKKGIFAPPKDFDPNYFHHPQGHPRETVIIHEGGPDESKQQFVSLNGFPFLIVRGKEVSLPIPVIEMLERCVQSTFKRDDETGELVETISPRFPMTRFRTRGNPNLKNASAESDGEDWGKGNEGT